MKRRVRAYSRADRKRLIIYHLADAMRKGIGKRFTTAEIARMMDIIPSTKLRDILWELTDENILHFSDEEDASLLGYRTYFELNPEIESYYNAKPNRHTTRMEREIRLNSSKGSEALYLS
jgi:hypothetical protein